MATQIQVDLIETEMVKPLSPTPANLRALKLSFIDQLAPFLHTIVVLYYPNTNLSIEQRSRILKKSFSQTLTEFYPFAGRLKDNLWLDCNDAGAELGFTRIHSPMSKFVQSPDSEHYLNLIVPPTNCVSREAVLSSPLLVVRVSFFSCGGTSICVRISHKVCDGLTLSTFNRSWSATASSICSGLSYNSIPQNFVSSTFFPPCESLASVFKAPEVEGNFQTKRLVFNGNAIAALRSRTASPSVPHPTRVEAVFAVLWKALIDVFSRCTKSVLSQHVNLRPMVSGSFLGNHSGNLAWVYSSVSDRGEARTERELVISLRNGFKEFKEHWEERTRIEGINKFIGELSRLRQEGELKVYQASSLCRIPWYELDFGWGQPTLVSFPNHYAKNTIYMLDSKDGDNIDVWLSLSKEDMAVFEGSREVVVALHPFILSSI